MATDYMLPSSSSSASIAAGASSVTPINGNAGSTFDITALETYLEALLPVLMSAHPRALQETLFTSEPWTEVANAFANDSSVMVVYVEKVRRETPQGNDDEGECICCRPRNLLPLETDPHWHTQASLNFASPSSPPTPLDMYPASL